MHIFKIVDSLSVLSSTHFEAHVEVDALAALDGHAAQRTLTIHAFVSAAAVCVGRRRQLIAG